MRKTTLLFSFLLVFLGSITYGQQLYPYGASKKKIKIKELKDALTKKDFVQARKLFFGEIADLSLPDIICYINSHDVVTIGLTLGNSSVDSVVWDKKKIWIIVFSDKDFIKEKIDMDTATSNKQYLMSCSIKSDTLRQELDTIVKTISEKKVKSGVITVRRETLQYEPEPGQYSFDGIIKAVTKIFVTSAPDIPKTDKVDVLKDSSQTLEFKRFSDSNPAGDSIFMSIISFDIPVNSKTRIVFEPGKGAETNVNYIDYNVGNFERTKLGIGIGTGLNYNPFQHKFFGVESQQVTSKNLLKLYLSVYYYIKSPQLPINENGVALFVGTNLYPASIYDDFIFGVRLGGKGGLLVGGNYMLSNNVRRTNLIVGIDYKL